VLESRWDWSQPEQLRMGKTMRTYLVIIGFDGFNQMRVFFCQVPQNEKGGFDIMIS
jgi:hypothetical protein